MGFLGNGLLLVTELGKFLGRRASLSGGEPLIVAPDDLAASVYGERKVLNPYTLFDLNTKYDVDTDALDTSITGAGAVTHQAALSAVRAAVTAANGDFTRVRSNRYFYPQSGKDLVIRQGVVMSALVANQVRRWGAFDDNDGFYFQTTGTTVQLVRQSSSGSGTTTVASGSWDDPMNGSGPSGKTLDVTKANRYDIHVSATGSGKAKYYINGYLVHTLDLAGNTAFPMVRSLQLPVAWEVQNTAASAIGSLDMMSCSVEIPGGSQQPSPTFAAANLADITVTTTLRPVLSIRPKQTYNGITNRAIIIPLLAGIKTEGARITWQLLLNPTTLTGATFAQATPARSKTEVDVAATALTGGTLLYQGFIPNTNDGGETRLKSLFDELDRFLKRRAFSPSTNPDILTVAAINEAAGNTLVRASLSYRELGL